jgi:glycolate oxidase FAD binding subunit
LTQPARDDGPRLIAAVREARARGRSLVVAGSGSKSFLMPARSDEQTDADASLLSIAEHSGVVEYRPEELVLTARAGTPLQELNQLVAHHQQMLPFEPPMFAGGGTLGGAVACGLSGPGRPWWGSVRDSVLGVELINGLGEALKFGGKVIKNVAGYDLSRLQVGAFGTLGIIMTVSIKLLPRPAAERTCTLALSATDGLARVRQFARQPLPVSATAFDGGLLRIRLSGAEAAVISACAEVGGDMTESDRYWQQLRDHELSPFKNADGLWRASLPPAADVLLDDALIEWGGALRWLARADDDVVRVAEQAGGSAAAFADGFAERVAATMPGALGDYHRRLKTAFDPDNILNAGLVGVYAN